MAISEKQLIANSLNAQKSTGPKDTTLTRLNALKHGLLSKEVLIKGEDKKALEELGKKLRTDLAPQNELENILVDRMVSSLWRLKRAVRAENGFLSSEYEERKFNDFTSKKNSDSKIWNIIVSSEMGNGNAWSNLIRYESTIERQIYKSIHELIRLQGARKGEKPPAPIALDVEISD
jgi:hypothetical protein